MHPRFPLRRALAVAAVTPALALSACGADGDAAARPAAGPDAGAASTSVGPVGSKGGGGALPDACEVFAEADLAALFGPLGERPPGDRPTTTLCYFLGDIAVTVAPASAWDTSVATQQAEPDATCEPADAGDKASWCTWYGKLGSLLWAEGDVAYYLQGPSLDRERFIALAETV